MAGLIAGGTVVYVALAVVAGLLGACSACWVEYRSHKKRQRVRKLIDTMR